MEMNMVDELMKSMEGSWDWSLYCLLDYWRSRLHSWKLIRYDMI